MIRKGSLLLAAILICFTQACGDNVCDHAKESIDHLEEAFAGCTSEPLELTVDATCEMDIETCTDSDIDMIESMLDCFDDLPNCTPANQETFAAAAQVCLTMGNNLTAGCNP